MEGERKRKREIKMNRIDVDEIKEMKTSERKKEKEIRGDAREQESETRIEESRKERER